MLNNDMKLLLVDLVFVLPKLNLISRKILGMIIYQYFST